MSFKDTRRRDKFAASKKRFANGKHQSKTKRDKSGPRVRPSEDPGKNGGDRHGNKLIAEETIKIINEGQYEYNDEIISIKECLDYAKKNTITYDPLILPIDISAKQKRYETEFNVINCSTLKSCYEEFYDLENKDKKICILNFASAKNPGGGFLNGSNAQEESIARCSGLYECIKDSPMYQVNKEDNHSYLYSGHIIYSDKVPIFRNDDDNELLESPYEVSILTTPAVNTSKALQNNVDPNLIDSTMYQRIDNMFSIAVNHDIDVLILGAWGCGIFGGDFNKVGRYFVDQLTKKYDKYFKSVIFAVKSDNSKIIEKILDDYF